MEAEIMAGGSDEKSVAVLCSLWGSADGALTATLKCGNAGHRECCDAFLLVLSTAYRPALEEFLQTCRKAKLHDAEDAVADVLVDLYTRARERRFRDPPGDWGRYLRLAVQFRYYEERKRCRRSVPRPRDVKLNEALWNGPRPDADAESLDEIRRWFQLTLPSLTKMEKWVIAMRGQGWTYAEIADGLGLSVGSASVLAWRARKKLRKVLSKQEAAGRKSEAG